MSPFKKYCRKHGKVREIKKDVIAKISCCFYRSIVTLKLRKEYLNTVIDNTPVLL